MGYGGIQSGLVLQDVAVDALASSILPTAYDLYIWSLPCKTIWAVIGEVCL